jgi:O-acetylhomoserine (thiol)-lyase
MKNKLDTIAIHAGQERPDTATGARAATIYQITSYDFNETAHAANLFALNEFGNIYTRTINPTTYEFKKKIAVIKGGCGAMPRDMGACISPFNSWLLSRGLEILPLRQRKHSENAIAVGKFLQFHRLVECVNYPRLEDHPSHFTAKKYFTGNYGALAGFGIKGGLDAGRGLIESVQLLSHMVNIGDAKSLVIHPASTTHQKLTRKKQTETGVSEDYIRLSVGIEDPEDIIDDIDLALKKAVS